PGGLLDGLIEGLEPPPGLIERLDAAVPDPPGPASAETSRFKPGFSPELDRLRGEERAALADLDRLEREAVGRTGIRSLKIGYNQVFGYYFEVGKAHAARVPPDFRRRQTLAQGERFTTDALEAVELQLRELRERLQATESELWDRWLEELDHSVPELQRIGRQIGEVDALAAFAHLAVERGYTRPVVDDSTELVLREARHPVLDRGLRERFVPNDTELDAAGPRMLVLTGPNMSGKSTYMRQVGLLVVLAQAGSFVPARHARIGRVDSLFTRMGFTDEIGRGKSSFMVEMLEVAEILREAGPRSLVLLDEIGRGTSTFDGLALAWASIRHLAEEIRCRTIVATHYHQLTALVEGLQGARNAHLAAQERPEGIVFLHRVVPGSTDRSFGLHVARLAGVPPAVLREAQRLLDRLEEPGSGLPTGPGRSRPVRYTQAILLPDPRVSTHSETLAEELRSLDLATLTPEEALAWLRDRQRDLRARPPGHAP
ncbi:MAG: DNA mismatch repair protein MutS, partial [Thermoplasmata archaeon]